MSLIIELSSATKEKLDALAAERGKSLETYARDELERLAASRPTIRTFDEILAPFRQSFAESGITEEELDALIEAEREAIYREKHGHGSKK